MVRVLANISHTLLSVRAFLGHFLDVAELSPYPRVRFDRDNGMHLLSFDLARVQPSIDYFGVHIRVGAAWLTSAVLITQVP